MNLHDLARDTGIGHRQLQRWAREGIIPAPDRFGNFTTAAVAIARDVAADNRPKI